nr:lytic transglycosylase domain-containing protein [uncultured Brevundimonas sp.]
MLDLAAVFSLSLTCAPSVAPETLAAIAHVESRFDALAIGVNRGGRNPPRARTPSEAARQAHALLARGANIDLGLAQINSDNLEWLGLSVEQAFDPCRNLAAAATVLRAGYWPEANTTTGRQTALRVALSRYNTGDPRRGFRNGYVRRVEDAAVTLGLASPLSGPRSDQPVQSTEAEVAAFSVPPSIPPWDIFARSSVGLVVFSTSAER